MLVDGKRLVVADAGGNTLLKVRKHGAVEVLSLFPDRLVQNPFGADQIPMQAVPTSVVKGPGRDYFMSQLTGFPFPVGAANVYRVDRKTGDAEVLASGFTNIMDLAFDEHGTLWVLEIDHDSLLAPIGPSTDGAIFAVDRAGQKHQLPLDPGTLTEPGGITVGDDGALYVTNKSRAPGEGEVLRIDVGADADHDEGDDDHGHEHGHGHERPVMSAAMSRSRAWPRSWGRSRRPPRRSPPGLACGAATRIAAGTCAATIGRAWKTRC